MINDLEQLKSDFQSDIEQTKSQDDVIQLKSKYLGKKGLVSGILKNLKSASIEEKRSVGKYLMN